MKKNSFLSIIIANFNGEKYLNTCLKSIFKSAYQQFEILVVDDGSTDKSLEIIRRFQVNYNKIRLLINKKNLGAAASRNRAIKKAKGKILVFLDNDTEVTNSWLDELIKPLLREKDIGATQAVLLDFERRNLIQMAGGKLIKEVGWLAPFHQWQKYNKVKKLIEETNIVAISAALAVKKEVIDKIGVFDGKEGIHTEDLDLCWRIWLAGYRIVLVPEAIVYHRTKSVRERSEMRTSNKQIYFHLAKNSIRSLIKNYELVNVFRYLPSTILVNFVRGFLVLVKRRDASALFGTFSALVWNFWNLTNTIICRLEIQKIRKVPDSFLFSRIFERGSLLEIYKRHFRQTRLLW